MDAVEILRPLLQVDGGDVGRVRCVDGEVSIELLGACGGCPVSTVTLIDGVERVLMARVPGVTKVVLAE